MERRWAPAPFLWHSRTSSQGLGLDTSFIYFCPPDALCRQQWHLCQAALAGCQTPQSHQNPPRHSPLPPSFPNLISSSPEDLDVEGWVLAQLPHSLGWGMSHPVPSSGEAAPSAFLLWSEDGSRYFSACLGE